MYNLRASPDHNSGAVQNRLLVIKYADSGLIRYAALTDPDFAAERTKQDFQCFATYTCKHARKLFGPRGEQFVRLAWAKVGVLPLQGFNPSLNQMGTRTEDQESRLDCSTGQYHSVVIISEDMLNAQLKSYYNYVPDLRYIKESKPLLKIGIDAKLLPPRVQILADERSLDRSKVVYHLRIAEGTITHLGDIPEEAYDPDVHAEQLQKSKIKNWDFAFQVNLGKPSTPSAHHKS